MIGTKHKKILNYCCGDEAPFQGFQIQFVDFLCIPRPIAVKSSKDIDGIVDDTADKSREMSSCSRHHAGRDGP